MKKLSLREFRHVRPRGTFLKDGSRFQGRKTTEGTNNIEFVRSDEERPSGMKLFPWMKQH